ncbi:hypothetical protein CLV98_102286 [Dyadobacter jejuensis]|uniref:Uncharacterized protein n=1 Tax=Dyadobacter jejuensis TaxID=1082580 RepID=A0A316AP25_9BACT|nr:hypothetical protein CLV98_102286 [Dyadobacter jejuensis]
MGSFKSTCFRKNSQNLLHSVRICIFPLYLDTYIKQKADQIQDLTRFLFYS